MLEARLLQLISTEFTPVRLADLLRSESLRLPRQHSSTRLQELVGAACPCIDCIYDLVPSLAFGSLPAFCYKGSGPEALSCCPGLHEGAASDHRDVEVPLDAEQLEQIEEATATLLSSAKVITLLQTIPKHFHCPFHDKAIEHLTWKPSAQQLLTVRYAGDRQTRLFLQCTAGRPKQYRDHCKGPVQYCRPACRPKVQKAEAGQQAHPGNSC